METKSSDLSFQAPEPGELAHILPGYEVESLIAVGGMGAVYRAMQVSLGRAVAIKILPKELGGDLTFRAQFETEAKAMALLNHPNLAGVYDFGNVQGLLYIVMEFVEGQSLYHYAYGKFLDPDDAIGLVRGICLGLDHAHAHGILHRDIKPSNILLDPQGQPKIVDFGLAQDMLHAPGAEEEVFGTPHYTAPEVLGRPGYVNARADIFSVGVILHELLTGRVPANDPRTASAIVQCDPRLDVVVRKATHPNPDFRYGSSAEMAAELEMISQTPAPRALRTDPQVAWTPGGHRPTTRITRPMATSSSEGPGIGVVIFVLIVAVLALLFYQMAR
jgi:serine/threonine protein kinase